MRSSSWDEEYNLTGLITIKTSKKIKKYPLACKAGMGRLRVGAAWGLSTGNPGPALLRPGST
jgi:hypothetical protein